MPDETRTFESDAEMVKPRKVVLGSKRSKTKFRQKSYAPLKVEMPPTRELILRLIELIKHV